MQDAIHPQYFPNAKVHCSGCNRTFEVGSTVEEIHVELCSNCHPFYTGKQKLVDTAGRVERFQARQARAVGGKTEPAPEAKSAEDTAPTENAAPTTEDRLAAMKKNLEDQ